MVAIILNPNDDCLTGVLKEFGTNAKQLKQDVALLMEWMGAQPHLPHIEDENLLQNFYLRSKCSMERTKKTLDLHYTLKTAVPEFFIGRDPTSTSMKLIPEYMPCCVLPIPTYDGYRVALFTFKVNSAKMFVPQDYFKYACMMGDIMLKEDTTIGSVFVIDIQNVDLGHIKKLDMAIMKKMDTFLRKGYSARIKGFHFLNVKPVAEVLVSMFKAVTSAKIASRIHVHSSLESLHGHVEKEVLPREYGGPAESLQEITSKVTEELVSRREWFREQELIGKADETKRPGKPINTSELFGIEGTFKKLAID